jgi:hypothetical protein
MRSKLQGLKVRVCRAVVCACLVLVAAALLLLRWGAHRFEEKTSHLRATATAAQGTGAENRAEPAVRVRAVESYGKLPLSFEINRGQTDPQVKFLSRGSDYSLFLTGNEAVLALRKGSRQSKVEGRRGLPGRQRSADLALRSAAFPKLLRLPTAGSETNSRTTDPKTGSALQALALLPTAEQFMGRLAASEENPVPSSESQAPAVLRMKLVGANLQAKVTGLEELPGKSNYFIGNDPRKWRTNVSNYAKVKYANVYPGVDLVYYGNQGKLEYDFVVQPYGDPGSIELAIDADGQAGSRQKAVGSGTEALESQWPMANRQSAMAAPLRVNGNGDLVVGTGVGEVIFRKPVVYQPATYYERRTRNKEPNITNQELIEGKYVVDGSHISFEVASYDKTRPLVIDPVLVYSTYLGGGGVDQGNAIAVDASGNVYVTVLTNSANFPATSGAFQTTFGGGIYGDAFVSKLNQAGSALLYSTYLGGTGEDFGYGIAVDASGDAYVTGVTSGDFPTTPGAFQTTFGGGFSCGPDCVPFAQDAFITKLSADGATLLYSTYLGGSGEDDGFSIAVDALGDAYVTGVTSSIDYPPPSHTLVCLSSNNFPITPGAFQTTYNGATCGQAFVSKLNAAGSGLLYSTYLGGTYYSVGLGVAVDASGNAYTTGNASSGFPITPGAFQTTPGTCSGGPCSDAFVSKLNGAGSALVYSTYLGGGGDFGVGNPAPANYAAGLAIDASGNAYIVGSTTSYNFPTTTGAFLTTRSGVSFGCGYYPCSAVFISKLNAAGSTLDGCSLNN